MIRTRLLDQLQLHISHVLLGDGMRLFDTADQDAVELAATRIIDTPDVTHIRYKVNGPSVLVIDERGRGTSPSRAGEVR